MGRKKARKPGKIRAPQGPTVRTGGYLTDIYVELGPMDSTATDLCPSCAGIRVVERGPFGAVATTESPAVGHAQIGTA